MSDDLGQPVSFKGPGQWRSQAETAQAHSRPPDAALEVLPPTAQRSALLDLDEDGLDEADVAALVAEAEQFAAEVSRFNPVHAPAGTPAGGQFAASSSSGTAPGTPAGNARQAQALRKRAKELRAEASRLTARLNAALARLKATAAAYRKAVAAANRRKAAAAKQTAAVKHTKAQAKKAAAGAKSAAYNAAHPGAQAAHRKAAKAKATAPHVASKHAVTVKRLHGQITRLRRRIHELHAHADTLDKQAAKLSATARRAEELTVVEQPVVVAGLDWDPVEYLLRAVAAHGHWNPKLHPRGPDGEFASTGGGAHPGAAKRPPGWPVNAPAPARRPQPAGMGPDLTVADLMSMVTDLHNRLDEQAPRLQEENARQLRAVTDQIRAEEKRLADQELAKEKAADLKLEKRKALIRTIATILGLVAVAALILVTHGAALPPLAEAGIAVGPLIGGELVSAIGEMSGRKRARGRLPK